VEADEVSRFLNVYMYEQVNSANWKLNNEADFSIIIRVRISKN
jgi:hypothetical protein